MNTAKRKRLCILSHLPDSPSTQKLALAVQSQFKKRNSSPMVQSLAMPLVEFANPFCDLRLFDLENTLFWPRLGDWQFESSIQRLLEFEKQHQQVKWINPPSALQLAKNKLEFQLKNQTELHFPKLLNEQTLEFPVVAKKISSSQGRGVHLIENQNQLNEFRQHEIRDQIFFQEFISDSDDCDYRVLILDSQILGIMKRENPSDFRKNISLGGIGSKAQLPASTLKLAVEASTKSGLNFSGVDLIISRSQGALVLEVNGSCGLNGYENFVDHSIYEKISCWISEMTFFR